MTMPIIVSYYTPDETVYVEAANTWIECIESLGLEFALYERPSHGSKQRNTLEKVFVICDAADEHGLPLIWIDVDSVVVRRPSFFEDCPYDFVAKHCDPPQHSPRYTGGCMYFADTDPARTILKKMRVIAEHNRDVIDEAVTELAVWTTPEANVGQLPPEYRVGERDNTIERGSEEAMIEIHRMKTYWSSDTRGKGPLRAVMKEGWQHWIC